MIKNIIATVGIFGLTTLGGVNVGEKNVEVTSISSMYEAIEKAEHELKLEEQKLLAEPNEIVEIELDEINDYGYDFYEKVDGKVDYMKHVFVDTETAEHWGIDNMKVHQSIKAIFGEEENWELYGFIKGSVD